MYMGVPKLGNIVWTLLPDTDSYNTTNQFPAITSTSILSVTIEENHSAEKNNIIVITVISFRAGSGTGQEHA